MLGPQRGLTQKCTVLEDDEGATSGTDSDGTAPFSAENNSSNEKEGPGAEESIGEPECAEGSVV